jgi:hypothetical protein
MFHIFNFSFSIKHLYQADQSLLPAHRKRFTVSGYYDDTTTLHTISQRRQVRKLSTNNTDFKTSVELLRLDNRVKYDGQFYTSKKLVEKAVGQFCFFNSWQDRKNKKILLVVIL